MEKYSTLNIRITLKGADYLELFKLINDLLDKLTEIEAEKNIQLRILGLDLNNPKDSS